MAKFTSNGSPRMSRKPTPTMKLNDDDGDSGLTPRNLPKKYATPIPLQSNNLGNLQANKLPGKNTHNKVQRESSVNLDDMLTRLRLNESRKPSVSEEQNTNSQQTVYDTIIGNLNERNRAMKQQEQDLKDDSDISSARDVDRSSGSDLFTPATDSFEIQPLQGSHVVNDTAAMALSEMERVKQELEAAKSVISRQEQELAEQRNIKHTMDQAMGPSSDGGFNDTPEPAFRQIHSAFNASARPFLTGSNAWLSEDDHTDTPAAVAPNVPYGRARPAFSQTTGLYDVSSNNIPGGPSMTPNVPDGRAQFPDYTSIYGQVPPPNDTILGQRMFSGSSNASFGYNERLIPSEMSQIAQMDVSRRRNANQFRSNSTFGDPLSPVNNHASLVGNAHGQTGMPSQYLQGNGMAVAGSPLNTDFPNIASAGIGSGYGIATPGLTSQTFVTSLEPMNYRRLLDKSVSCDWKYIVDKIVCNNDQQASIFLQQKLKVGTAEQKFEIVESIVNQAYPLMINRFGNFLVQRCFEHGTPEQVVAIANAIHGNVLSLSMDPFGCHVVQKAFDSVPEDHKANMVRELLRRIPDTVIHRYACHVWQKLFELRWSAEPPQIMTKVNDALQGMWHEVALGETGSLVVQNIFENCVEEEKRPAIEEVISNIDLIAHGQFGNWCIQHLCEHGSPPDKRRVIDHILANSYNYSIDQFASKVVEKCLKIGGMEFLDRYLSVITTAHPDRPRIPLIDIAGDQYGNYLIQWILMNTHQHQREQVAIHIRKHMVSLRGSKFGSRVAMLCCNPASITRPGPGALVNPFGAPGQPRNAWRSCR